jgi:hypothetical protein
VVSPPLNRFFNLLLRSDIAVSLSFGEVRTGLRSRAGYPIPISRK